MMQEVASSNFINIVANYLHKYSIASRSVAWLKPNSLSKHKAFAFKHFLGE